jgi:hypothetical protein
VLDCWNNGGFWDYDDGVCDMTGFCDSDGSACMTDFDCPQSMQEANGTFGQSLNIGGVATTMGQIAVPDTYSGTPGVCIRPNSCHERDLVNDDLGFHFEPPGSADPGVCQDAKTSSIDIFDCLD